MSTLREQLLAHRVQPGAIVCRCGAPLAQGADGAVSPASLADHQAAVLEQCHEDDAEPIVLRQLANALEVTFGPLINGDPERAERFWAAGARAVADLMGAPIAEEPEQEPEPEPETLPDDCHACVRGRLKPWVAALVTAIRDDIPCAKHRGPVR